VRRHKSLLKGNFHRPPKRDNFFLRGFNYLFILQKPTSHSSGIESNVAPRGKR
jgi:hypothetical protein